jgi:hypothetical protein
MGGYEVASLASRFAGQDTNEVGSICSTGDTEIRRLLSKLTRDPDRFALGGEAETGFSLPIGAEAEISDELGHRWYHSRQTFLLSCCD